MCESFAVIFLFRYSGTQVAVNMSPHQWKDKARYGVATENMIQ